MMVLGGLSAAAMAVAPNIAKTHYAAPDGETPAREGAETMITAVHNRVNQALGNLIQGLQPHGEAKIYVDQVLAGYTQQQSLTTSY